MELPIKSPKSKTGRRRAAARPEVTVAWPKGLLYPDTTYSIRLTIPPEITKLQIKCDFQDKYLWLTGPGKLAHANDFVCQAPAVGGNWQVELTLGIRPPEKPCLEPVSLALFDGEGELVGESVGQLSITPAAEAPELLHPLLKGLAWLMGTEPGKPMLVRVAHVLGRLA
ncbi:MAG TPA: hypothetical protein VG273_07575, partial [Bryobacteraceae bacterium]|nr:hypothetical protein [Bryobacteraceae bacterium]